MTTRTIRVPCADPTSALVALLQMEEIGFPIENGDVVKSGEDIFAEIRINMGLSHGVHHPMNQIRAIGLKPEFTSERK